MRVHIENDIWLQGDQYGCSIVKRSVQQSGKDKGKEFFAPVSHWSNVQQAVQSGLLKMKLAESTAETLRELIEEVQAYRRFVAEKINF